MSDKTNTNKAPLKNNNKSSVKKNARKPRRQKNRRRGGVAPKNAPSSGSNVKPGDIKLKFTDTGMKPAAASNMTTPIPCVLDNLALATYPCGITSNLMALSKSIDGNFFGFYYALVSDFVKVLSGATPLLESRFLYLNSYLKAYAPKSVPPNNPKYSVSWINTQSSTVITSNVNVRNYQWCCYVPTGSDEFEIQLFIPPPSIPSIDTALSQYSTVLQSAAGHQKNVDTSALSVQLVAESSTKYEADISPFALSYPAIGEGSTDSSSVYGTTEAELPFKSQMFGNICSFVANTSRTSNFPRNSSGDINSAMSLPFVPQYNTIYTDTVHPVKYKFIDFDELYLFMISWIGSCFQKADLAIVPFADKLLYFALRQSLLSLFQTSQAAGQFMTPWTDGGPEKWEAFRCGSNAISRISTGMIGPALIAENLRALMYRDSHNYNEKFRNDKNAIIYLPVWGRHVGRDIPTYSYQTTDGISHSVTRPSSGINEGAGIDPIDGFIGNNCYNLNSSNILNMIILWNETVGKISTFAGVTSAFPGSSNACLLTKTRYYDNFTFDFQDIEIPEFMAHSDIAKRIRDRKTQVKAHKPLLSKTSSKNLIVKPELILESVERSRVRSYSSISKIFDEDLSMFDFFILPFADISTGGNDMPGISQMKYQTQYRETESVRMETASNFTVTSANRAEEIINAARLCAPGIAKDASDEVTRSIEWLQKTGKGGFLSELLSGASQIAGMFGA